MQSLMGPWPCPKGTGCTQLGQSMKLPMERGFGKTDRTDDWWKGPTAMAAYLGIMVVYSAWRGMMEADFWIFEEVGRSSGHQTMSIESEGSHVLSPLFSPLVIPGGDGLGSMVPLELAWMSPAMFILIFPIGFRATCYYYRKAYYRAFMQQPTGCAVSKPWNEYSGETGLLLVQNLHRYFMYVALIYLPILSYDVWLSVNFHDAADVHSYGVSVALMFHPVLLMVLRWDTRRCRAVRRAGWGPANEGSSNPMSRLKFRMWRFSTSFNENHRDWALYSLFWVMLADFYIYACTDPMFGLTDLILWGGL